MLRTTNLAVLLCCLCVISGSDDGILDDNDETWVDIRSQNEQEALNRIAEVEGLELFDGELYRFDLIFENIDLYYINYDYSVTITEAMDTVTKLSIENDLDEELGPQSLAEAILVAKHILRGLDIMDGSNTTDQMFDIRELLDNDVEYDLQDAIEFEEEARFYYAPETLSEEDFDRLASPIDNITQQDEPNQCRNVSDDYRFTGMDHDNTVDFMIKHKGSRYNLSGIPDPYHALRGSFETVELYSKESVEIEPLCATEFYLLSATMSVQGAKKVKYTYYYDDYNKEPTVIEIEPDDQAIFTEIPLIELPEAPITQIRFKVTTESAHVTALMKDVAIEACCPDFTSNDPNPSIPERRKRNVKKGAKSWSMPIKYHIHHKFSSDEEDKIKTAINHWESETCIRFESSGRRRLKGMNFRKKESSNKFCGWSYVGRKWFGNRITLVTDAFCFVNGVIVHEIAHALGFYHEHTRPDRGDYVNIHWHNIRRWDKRNYRKHAPGNVYLYGTPYDYSSVMHYSRSNQLSIKDSTMTYVVGQRHGLSFNDAKIANFHICKSACGDNSLEWAMCQAGGYRDPNSCGQCKCPTGFAGEYCQHLATHSKMCAPAPYLSASHIPKTLSPAKYDFPTCTWMITAPSGSLLSVRFIGDFSLASLVSGVCFEEYVEIRWKNKYEVGARLCGSFRPTQTYVSSNNEILVILKSTGITGNRAPFTLQYSAARCGLCGNFVLSAPEKACNKAQNTVCKIQYSSKCGFLGWRRCSKTRYYSCYRSVPYCCQGNVAQGQCDVGCGGCTNKIIPYQPSCQAPVHVKISYTTYTKCKWGFSRCSKTKYKMSYSHSTYSCCDGYYLSSTSGRCISR